ncbi:TIGR03663 family protein, partial [Candidatus Sumerlaeota bacterium]|nr:TIGR03663 family protein [Candidatus Sumerlaeota bacterium]
MNRRDRRDRGVGLVAMDEQSPLTEAERPAKIGHTAWVLLIILPFVIFTRLWGLGQKPFHHDESLFASYAYHLRVTGDYDFNEILHGPFLEDVSALIFAIFGDSEVTARLWPAVAGSLLVLLVWRLRDLLGNLAALLGVVFLTASPTLMYYSRFNRNDVPFTFAAMLFVYCVARFFQRGRMWQWLLALMAVGWMICIEETYVIFLFTVATYAVALGLVEAAAGTPSSRRAAWARLSSSQPGFARKFALTTVLGLLAALLMIVTLYTTFFKHLEHADGPIEAIIYWAGQHREQRIFGEFHYYVPILLIYEFLFVAIFIWGVGRTLRRAAWLRGWIGWAWATWSVVLLAALWKHRIPDGLAAILHMQRGWHLWLAIEIFVLGAATCAVLVTERRLLDGFFVWWTVIAFLAYSYAGEKVPWIAVHVVFPMIVTAAIFVQEIARSAAISEVPRGRLLTRAALRGFARTPALAFFVVALPATTAIALRLSFVNDANPAERHVYTHTTDDYKAMIEEVVDIASASGQPPIS